MYNLEESGENLPIPTKSGLPEFVEPYPYTLGDPEYSHFEDPASPYYQVSPDFTPRTSRPIPSLRCTRIKKDGERCGNWGIRGLGVTPHGPPALCRKHGGSLPNFRKHADAVVEAARLQLTDGAPDAIATIMFLMKNGDTADAVRLAAAKDVLDRANVKGSTDINVEVTQGEAPSAKFMKMMDSMRKDGDLKNVLEEEQLEDLGESDAEEGKEN